MTRSQHPGQVVENVMAALATQETFERWVENPPSTEFTDTRDGNVISVYLERTVLPAGMRANLDVVDFKGIELAERAEPSDTNNGDELYVPLPGWAQSVYRQLRRGLAEESATSYLPVVC
jgi:hypothetical protein